MNKAALEPAFPTLGQGVETEGMTLRDYFAGKALQGFAADPSWDAYAEEIAKRVARNAYLWADAMLKEREK